MLLTASPTSMGNIQVGKDRGENLTKEKAITGRRFAWAESA